MSVAIMVHKEANGTDGGYLNPGGPVAGDTFYARKLNTLLVNQSSTLVSFDGTNFTFTVSPGVYRIDVGAVFNPGAVIGQFGYHLGLYNLTTGSFEVYTGGTEAIISSTAYYNGGQTAANRIVRMTGQFTVSASNKTYQIRHKSSSSLWAASTQACGINDQMTGANVNSAAASQFYMMVKLGLES